MDKQQWKKVSRIFDIALTLPAERRTTYIKNLCADDPELQKEINELLASIEESDQMLEEHLRKNEVLLNDLTSTLEQGSYFQSVEGSVIGGWQVMELLGRGGMGDVYKVERIESDIHQQGALKIMRRGLDTPENICRFRLEKQILAGLHHPNIASLIEGGVSEDGLPYLVMEYVEGEPLLEYCDNERLTINQRLKLFNTICDAVRYAHKNLIVHRDLKPDNLLVTEEGRVKILDFGIAKLLDPDLYEFSTVETRQGTRLMSLEYAAPEQVSGETVTTSTDLYALGVLLYELLAGVHPFDFDQKKYRSIVQTIHEEPPSSLSYRLRNLSDTELLSEIAENRSLPPSDLIKNLKGDLDAIVLKALRKKPEGRYNSPDQFKGDVTFYLQDKPILARGEAIKYRLRKFIRRHRWGVAAALIAAISLIGGSSIALWQADRANRERDQARIEKNKAEEVTRFLTNLFEANHPDMVQGEMPTARDLLDVGVQRINTSFTDNPELRAEMQALLGKLYFILDEHEEALPLLEEGLALAEKNNDVDTQTEALRVLSLLYGRASDYEKSLAVLQQANKLLKEEGRVPSLGHAKLASEIQSTLTVLNRSDEALKLTETSLELARNDSHLSPEGMFYYLKAHGTQLRRARQFNEAKLMFEEALELDLPPEQAPKKRFEINESLLYIAYYRGDHETALSLHSILLKQVDEIFPKIHGAKTHLLDIISRSLIRFGRLDEAERIMRQGLDIQKKVYPSQNRYYLGWAYARLGHLLRDKERYSEAFQNLEQARDIFRYIYGKDYHLYSRMTADMGDLLRRQGLYQKSQVLLSDALQRSRANPETHPTSNAVVQFSLAKLRLAQNRPKEALVFLHNAINKHYEIWNSDKRLLQEILVKRAQILTELGNTREAEAAYTQAIAMGDQISLFRGIAWPNLLTDYARFLVENTDPRAPAALKRALKANYNLYGDTHPTTQRAEDLLAFINTH